MNPRRITLALGTSAGGLLAAAFAWTAVATADTFDYVLAPGSQPESLAITGIPPWFVGSETYDLMNVDDTTVGTVTNPDVVGVFNASVTTLTTASGFSNVEMRAVFDQPLPPGLGIDEPPPGSVFDNANFGNGFENIYSDVVGAGANGTNLITDTFDTPFGDFNMPTDFDAAALIDAIPTITP
jgi:hypothetical protein